MRDMHTKECSQATKGTWRPGMLAGLVTLAEALAGCGEPSDVSGQREVHLDGRLAISWTLNGNTLNQQSCRDAGIGYLDIGVTSQVNQSLVTGAWGAVCGLDRFSIANVPNGPVSIAVFARPGTYRKDFSPACIYLGRVDAVAGTEFPNVPISVVLLDDGECFG